MIINKISRKRFLQITAMMGLSTSVSTVLPTFNGSAAQMEQRNDNEKYDYAIVVQQITPSIVWYAWQLQQKTTQKVALLYTSTPERAFADTRETLIIPQNSLFDLQNPNSKGIYTAFHQGTSSSELNEIPHKHLINQLPFNEEAIQKENQSVADYFIDNFYDWETYVFLTTELNLLLGASSDEVNIKQYFHFINNIAKRQNKLTEYDYWVLNMGSIISHLSSSKLPITIQPFSSINAASIKHLITAQELNYFTKKMVRLTYPTPFWRQEGYSGQSIQVSGLINHTLDVSKTDEQEGILLVQIDADLQNELSVQSRKAIIIEYLTDIFGSRANEPLDYYEYDMPIFMPQDKPVFI